MIYGVFHGDLHGGNLVVQPDGRTALFDFGMTGRLSEPQRLAFLRLLMFGTTGDQRGQLVALRDLGAFPPDVDLDALARDLDLDGPVKDPTQMSADDLMAEMRDVTKKLLGYGARVPEGAHAVREEHDVPQQRDRDPRARSRHAPADDVDLHVLRRDPRRAHPARGRHRRQPGRTRSRRDEGGVPRRLRHRHAHVPRPAGAPRRGAARSCNGSASASAGACVDAEPRRPTVPELPQMQALAERLGDAITGQGARGRRAARASRR